MFDFLLGLLDSDDDDKRIARMEKKLDRIIEHLGIDVDDIDNERLVDEAQRLADQGRKIEAIKAHREATGAGLSETKKLVDAYMREIGLR